MFKALLGQLSSRSKANEKANLWVIPSADTNLQNDIARLVWYFLPVLDKIDSIFIRCETQWPKALTLDIFDGSVTHSYRAIKPRIKALSSADWDTARSKVYARSKDYVANFNSDFKWKRPRKARLAFHRSPFSEINVDRKASRNEGSLFLWQGRAIAGAQLQETEIRQRFERWVAQSQKPVSYVFGTGPSFSSFVAQHDFEDANVIFTNSMVKDLDLVKRLRPSAIVAADPIFHAGCSRYAEAFRLQLKKALQASDAVFFFPERDAHIYFHYLAEFSERFIPVSFNPKRRRGLCLMDEFSVHPYPNVLTLLLLPLACAVSTNVKIIGCDGRDAKNDKLFWAHDAKVQFEDEMENIREVHPSFFSVSYEDYYNKHCENLADLIEAYEQRGLVFDNMTPSYIPCLADRFTEK